MEEKDEKKEENLELCPYCKKMCEDVKRRTYFVKTGNVGKVTSQMEMCIECFNKITQMVK